MMIRRLFTTSLLILCTTVVALGARPVTFVLKSGDRLSGELSYKGGGELTLNVNGQVREIPWSDVALIAFVPGDPSVAELGRLPASDNPPELERHTIVLKDGGVLRGKLHRFSPDGETVTYDPLEGGMSARRDVSSSQVARIYLSAPDARTAYRGVLFAPGPVPVATTGTGGTTVYNGNGVAVNANHAWTDTGITVKKGARVAFNASGKIRVADGDAPDLLATPDGSGTFQGSRSAYPVPAMSVGGLIGKVGNSAPFPIGANTQPIVMPATGRLSLGINDDHVGDNSGTFSVTIGR